MLRIDVTTLGFEDSELETTSAVGEVRDGEQEGWDLQE